MSHSTYSMKSFYYKTFIIIHKRTSYKSNYWTQHFYENKWAITCAKRQEVALINYFIYNKCKNFYIDLYNLN